MKFEPPQGSVFGGYGFWSYSATSHPKPSAGSANPRGIPFGARLRCLTDSASRLLRLIRL